MDIWTGRESSISVSEGNLSKVENRIAVQKKKKKKKWLVAVDKANFEIV